MSRNDESQSSPGAALEQLRNAGQDVISSWIKRQLLGYGEAPHAIAPREGNIVDGIITILRPGWSEERRVRIGEAVGSLMGDWTETTDPDLDLLGGLSCLISGLRLSSPDALLRHLDGDLKGRVSRFGDVHALALGAALNPSRRERNLLHVLRRDVGDPRYAATCAIALLERYPEDAREFLPQLINNAVKGREWSEWVDLESLLRTSIMILTVEVFLESLRGCMWFSESVPERECLTAAGRSELVRVCGRCPEVFMRWPDGPDPRIVMLLCASNPQYRPLLVPLDDHPAADGLGVREEHVELRLQHPGEDIDRC